MSKYRRRVNETPEVRRGKIDSFASNGALSWSLPFTFTVLKLSEDMTDEDPKDPGYSRGDARTGATHYCSASKYKVIDDVKIVSVPYPDDRVTVVSGYGPEKTLDAKNFSFPGLYIDPAEFAQYVNDHVTKLGDIVDNDTTLINSLLEIKQVKDLRRFNVPKVLRNWRFHSKAYKKYRELLRQGSRSAADEFLKNQFGFLPLISDVEAILKAIVLSGQELERLRGEVGQPITVRSGITRTFEYPFNYAGGYNGAVLHTHRITERFNVRSLILREIAWLNDHVAVSQIIGAHLGLKSPTATIWEAIPYSFVVDWFIDVQTITRRMDQALSGVSYTLLDQCWSQKQEAEFIHGFGFADAGGKFHFSGNSVKTRYTRTPTPPSVPLISSGLSGRRLLLALSLLRQKFR